MSRTYLELTNEILSELNEVKMSSSNFANAAGIQAFVKEAINRAYSDIVGENPEAPWLLTNDAQDDDASEYGNYFVDTVVGQRWYYLKKHSSGTSGTAPDFGRVDWDSFYLTTDTVGSCSITGMCSNASYITANSCITNNASWTDYDYQSVCEDSAGTWTATHASPYVRENIDYVSFEEWKDHYRESDDNAKDSGVYSEPVRVIMNHDGRRFGLSPLPDKVYRIYFTAWEQFQRLSAYDDTPLFSEQWTTVLVARAKQSAYMFKDQTTLSQLANQDYKRGLRNLKEFSGKQQFDSMSDDRTRF